MIEWFMELEFFAQGIIAIGGLGCVVAVILLSYMNIRGEP